MQAMRPFWIRSGLALLDVDDEGRLRITDELLRAYVQRPELAPIEESCAAECALHASLLDEPRRAIDDSMLNAIGDADARDNWRLFLRFRGRLLASPTLEACYTRIFADAQASGRIDVPPLFVDQLAQMLVHHLLIGCDDGLTLRMAELWFREQRATIHDGRVMLADLETVEARLADPGLGDLGRLLAQSDVRPLSAQLDVIDRLNAQEYFGRDERHDFAVELGVRRASAQVFADVLRAWIGHLCGVAVKIRPLEAIDDPRWRWHAGLDAQASALLNALYANGALDPGEHRRLLLLLRLDFERLDDARADVAGKPVYLALAMDADGVVRMKPQNVLFNLPLARPLAGPGNA